MKKYFVLVLGFVSQVSFAAVTAQITELDKSYTLHTICAGSAKTNDLPANTTTSFTIQGSAPCKIDYNKGGVVKGDIKELKGGEKFTIKNGELKLK